MSLLRPTWLSLPFTECSSPPGSVRWFSPVIPLDPHSIPLGVYHHPCYTKEELRQKLNDSLKVAPFRNLAGPRMLADSWAWVFPTTSCSFLWEEGLLLSLRWRLVTIVASRAYRISVSFSVRSELHLLGVYYLRAPSITWEVIHLAVSLLMLGKTEKGSWEGSKFIEHSFNQLGWIHLWLLKACNLYNLSLLLLLFFLCCYFG